MFCSRCQQFWNEAIAKAEIPDYITRCEDVLWAEYEIVLHSTLRELKLASDLGCILCRIIFNTPTGFEHGQLLSNDTEALSILLDIDPTKGPHPVLSVTFREASGDGIRIPKRMVAACGGLLRNGKHLKEHKQLLSDYITEDQSTVSTISTLRRCIESPNDSTGSDGALHLAASWVEGCVSKHEVCRVRITQGQSSFVPTRLLDVSNSNVRLVETNTATFGAMDRRYIALSHCWGKIHIIRTLTANYEDHLSQISFEDLSKTFKDAVHTTRKLGFQYLWIDSLCIIQDDSKDWAAEAATMCNVYQYATLTIAAAHAAGGDVGCFKDRDGLLQMPFIIDIPQDSPDLVAHVLFTSYGRSEGISGPEPPLYGRAWVLQEQLLSPRMLVFDGSQLRWECLTTHASERSHLGGMSRHVGHQKAVRQGIMNDVEFFSNEELVELELGARTQHLYWCYTVMDYTHRGMTQPKDRLIALAGTAQALGKHTKSQYLAGLWSRFFWAGLLWSIPHTREYTPTTMDAFSLEDNKKIRHPEPLAPSWSWASVTAPVVYPSPTLISLDPICTIISTSTSPIAATQTGRAEIHGHIRKGYVNVVYPFAIRETATRHRSHMTMHKPEGQKDFMTFKGRAFPPNDYFLFSKQRPKMPYLVGSDLRPTSHLTRSWDWRFMRGTFRPDEIISCEQEITFLAIAQQNLGHQPPSLLETHESGDPLRVYTIALVPTGKYGEDTGEHRRVGYAVWSDCAWYGYNCGHKKQPGAEIEKPGRWTEGHGWEADDGFFDTLKWWIKWDDLEYYKKEKKSGHVHSYEADALPDLRKYHKDVGIEEKVLIVV